MHKIIEVERRVTGLAVQTLKYEVSAADWYVAVAKYEADEAVSELRDAGKLDLLESYTEMDEVIEVHEQAVEVVNSDKSDPPEVVTELDEVFGIRPLHPEVGNSDIEPASEVVNSDIEPASEVVNSDIEPHQGANPMFKPRLDMPFEYSLFVPADPVVGQRMEMQHVDDSEVWNFVEVKYVSESWVIVLTLDVAHTQELLFDPNEVRFATKRSDEEARQLKLKAESEHLYRMMTFYSASEMFDAGWRLRNVNFPEEK